LNRSTLEKALGRALNYQRKAKREQKLANNCKKNTLRNLILGYIIEDYPLIWPPFLSFSGSNDISPLD